MDLQGKKIWITCGGGIGDSIMFTPALRRMKELYPASHITFMTRWPNQAILQGLPYIDELTYIRRGTLGGRWRVLPALCRRQDAIVFTDWQPQLLLAAKFFGIPWRAGYPRDGHRFSKYLTKEIEPNVFHSACYAAETNARVFSDALGIVLDGDMTKPDIGTPTQEDCHHVSGMLREMGLDKEEFVILSPFAALAERNWPLKEAARFIQIIEKKYQCPVLVTGPSEHLEAAQSLSRFNLIGRTTVGELVEIIRRAKILVTPDSGPMHIAGALGTPVVPLFSKDLPSRWAPRYRCEPVYLALPCSPCDDDTARCCPRQVECMRGITADRVFAACEMCLSI